MRHVLTALSLLAVATSTAIAATPDVARVIERSWHGGSSAPVDWVQGGTLYVEEWLSLSIDASDHITGSAEEGFTLDGVHYAARYTVSGSYDGRDGLALRSTLVSRDALPGGLRWCGGSKRLTIYNDDDHAGSYIMKGTSQLDCGGGSEVMYTDRL